MVSQCKGLWSALRKHLINTQAELQIPKTVTDLDVVFLTRCKKCFHAVRTLVL